jgi:exonuclease VII large subunit
MINLCTDPTCDEQAGVTIQRQVDVAPVPYCLEHGARRALELDQRLENYLRVVIAQQAPTELELAQGRVAELETRLDPETDTKLREQLDTALNTLELQSKALEQARGKVSETREELDVAKRELERTKRELERVRGDLTMATHALDLARKASLSANAGGGGAGGSANTSGAVMGGGAGGEAPAPMTPPPSTRPDPK